MQEVSQTCTNTCINSDGDPITLEPLWGAIVIRGGKLTATSMNAVTSVAEPVCFELANLAHALVEQPNRGDPLTRADFRLGDLERAVKQADRKYVCKMPNRTAMA